MRHYKSEYYSEMGKRSQLVQANQRLSATLKFGAIRSVDPIVIFEIRTRNIASGQEHLLEIKHEVSNGNNRYMVYLDNKKLGTQWSKTLFCRWLFSKIDSVLIV